MDAAMQEFAHGMREALAIWLALLAACVVTFAVVSMLSRRGGAVPWWSSLRRAVRDPEAVRERQAKAELAVKEAEELRRYRDEVSVAASRTSVMAERRRSEWEAAGRTRDAAWRAYEQAEQEVRRLRLANAFPLPEDNPAERRRHLVRIVNAAHARGEISAAQLADALMHRNGWDPAAHPFQQELTLRKMIRDRLFRAYQQASAMERSAAAAADVAAASRRTLDDEVFRATLQSRPVTAFSKAAIS